MEKKASVANTGKETPHFVSATSIIKNPATPMPSKTLSVPVPASEKGTAGGKESATSAAKKGQDQKEKGQGDGKTSVVNILTPTED